ncbi:hypothetical protein CHUAL_009448 [Chamberlinius hualienensis]
MATRVYIGRLPYDVRERDLEKFFKGYGRIREILLKNGFGFVEFDDYRDADDAVYELNGKELLGERIIVARARGTARRRGGGGGGGGNTPVRRRSNWNDKDGGSSDKRGSYSKQSIRYGPPTRTEYRLIVENLSSRVSWQDLKDFMRQAGEVTYADAHKTHRNEGVVEFATYTDMKNAIEKLNDTELNGRRIKLVEDKSHKRRRSHSRSRSRSRSPRSRSRSRSRSPRSRSPRSRSKSKSKSKSSSRSRSPRRSPRRSSPRSRSKSASKSKSKSKSRSRSRSRGRSHSRNRSNSRDHSRSRSGSRRKSAEKSKSRSRSPVKSSKLDERVTPDKDSKND